MVAKLFKIFIYWRIVRINGDNTVRVIYDGTIAHVNGDSSEDRRVGTSVFNNNHNDNMKLMCPQQNDAFTVSDTTNGNGDLTYPIGLLSSNEIVLAGGWDEINTGYYLFSKQVWWAFSPLRSNGLNVSVRNVQLDGDANSYNSVNYSYGVRPVLNIRAEILKYGDGTSSNPYHL